MRTRKLTNRRQPRTQIFITDAYLAGQVAAEAERRGIKTLARMAGMLVGERLAQLKMERQLEKLVGD